MSTRRFFMFKMMMVVSLTLLAWTASAAPLVPGDSTSDSDSPLKLTITGSASRPQMDGTRITWVITAANTGTEALTNIVLVDTLPGGLALNRVDFQRGLVSLVIDRSRVTVTITELEPGAETQIYLYTNSVRRNSVVENSICVSESDVCTTASVKV